MNSTKQTILGFGLVASLFMIIFSLAVNLLNIPFNSPLNYATYLILVGVIIYAIIYRRDSLQNGFITFKEAFITGLIVGLVVAVIFGFWSIILIHVINPNIIDVALEASRDLLEERGLSEEIIIQSLKYSEWVFKPLPLFSITFFQQFVAGLIFSILPAAIFKRTP